MNRIFVDTSAWDAIADRADSNHERALLFRNEIAGHYALVTTNYILDELYTLFLINVGFQPAIRFKRQLDFLIEERVLEVIWIAENIATEAWEIFERYNMDKRWSFTDCTSYVVMKQLSITDAFAFDRHFEQMGLMRRP